MSFARAAIRIMRPADAAGIVAANDGVGWRGRQMMLDFSGFAVA